MVHIGVHAHLHTDPLQVFGCQAGFPGFLGKPAASPFFFFFFSLLMEPWRSMDLSIGSQPVGSYWNGKGVPSWFRHGPDAYQHLCYPCGSGECDTCPGPACVWHTRVRGCSPGRPCGLALGLLRAQPSPPRAGGRKRGLSSGLHAVGRVGGLEAPSLTLSLASCLPAVKSPLTRKCLPAATEPPAPPPLQIRAPGCCRFL